MKKNKILSDNSKIFVDMDQVLVELIGGIENIFDISINNTFNVSSSLKKEIKEYSNFWSTLPKTKDCDELWNHVKKYNPRILTAKPSWDSSASEQKFKWIEKNCPIPKINFYCVPREDKQKFATINGHSNILIDDYIKNCKEWEDKGGVAIQHKSAKITIIKLKLLGF